MFELFQVIINCISRKNRSKISNFNSWLYENQSRWNLSLFFLLLESSLEDGDSIWLIDWCIDILRRSPKQTEH